MNSHTDPDTALPEATDDQFGPRHDCPTFAGSRRVYLIASIPRSGSHFLSELLRQCGDLGKPFEYLNLGRRQQWLESTGTSNLADMLEALARRRTSSSGWFGCKTHWDAFSSAISDPEVAGILATRHYIHIRRRDKLAQAISQVIADQTQSWRSFQQPTCAPVYDRSAISHALEGLLRQETCWGHYFMTHALEPLTIDYEDLASDPQHCVDGIRDYLGMPHRRVQPAETRVQRQATSLSDVWRSRYERDA